jgi:hypothetical protein
MRMSSVAIGGELGDREAEVDRAGGDGRFGHPAEPGRPGTLHERHAILCLDGAKAFRAV